MEGTEFCWKSSYGRGVGKIPSGCPSSHQKIGLFCYPKCPTGMKRFGFDCHTSCPSGMTDQGLFCRKLEYGRGAGYAYWLKDRCNRRNSQGCEKHLAMWYPKCRAGYKPFGCCICRPSKPDCRALGMNGGIDLSCAKKIIIGKPSLGQCSSSQERQAGLCYKKCRSGHKGVGPVCWGQPPSGWSQCGMGAALNPAKCKSQILGAIMGVGELAMYIASLGTSTAATQPAKTSGLSKKFADMKKQFWDVVDKYPEIKERFEKAKKYKEVFDEKTMGYKALYKSLQIKDTDLTAADFVRISAQVLAVVDPTGISSTVAAFAYPTCSQIRR